MVLAKASTRLLHEIQYRLLIHARAAERAAGSDHVRRLPLPVQ